MQSATNPRSIVLRLFWALIGHAIVYMSLASIVARRHEFPSPFDAVVWLTVAAMLVARRVDIVRYGGHTLYGEPADLGTFRRFAALLVIVCAAATVAAHALAARP